MSLIAFESGGEKEKKREEKRKKQEEILTKAKREFDRSEEERERRRDRGEGTWILPHLDEKLTEKERKGKKEKKKKKKKKKKKGGRSDESESEEDKKKRKKKSKKKKKEDDDDSDDDSSNGDESDDEWSEKKPIVGPSRLERDDWMSDKPATAPRGAEPAPSSHAPSDPFADLVPSRSLADIKRERNKERDEARDAQRAAIEAPGTNARELNPYWKGGQGTGLPPEKGGRGGGKMSSTAPIAFDGGASWIQRAYKRCVEQAEREGRSLDEVASERYGSLSKLKEMMRSAGVDEDGRMNERRRDVDGRSEGGRGRTGDRRVGRDDRRDYRRDDGDRDSRERNWTEEGEKRFEGKSFKSRPGTGSRPEDKDAVARPEFARPGRGFDRDSGRRQERTSAPSWKREGGREEGKREKNREEKREETSSSSSSSEEEEKEEEEKPKATQLSQAEMNSLGAQILKAELKGDHELAAKLKAKLESGREARTLTAADPKTTTSNPGAELLVTRMDREGNVWPVDRPAEKMPGGARAKKRAKKWQERETHDDDGKRTRYFADDDKFSLKDLVRQEKMTSAKDQLNLFSGRRLASRHGASIRGEAEGNDGDFAVDDVFVAKSGAASGSAKTFDLNKSVFESRRIKAAIEACSLCIDNENKFLKHLMVSVSDKACLLLPPTQSLVEGHCYIVPLTHGAAVTGLDEDVFEEMQKYRRSLVRMFESEDTDCVFMETVLRLNAHPHAYVECVPLERELGDLAPIYFKKALVESDVEWAINKRLVDLGKLPPSAGGSIRRAVPRGMPYFHVDFGACAGFAHVIEEERMFKKNFGLEILGGMMDLDPFLWRKPPRETFEDQMKKCVEFSKKWRPFDWTESS